MIHLTGMRTLLRLLIVVPLLTACGGSDDDSSPDSCSNNSAPDTYKSGRKAACSGQATDDYACCGYQAETCSYTLCRKSLCGEWEEQSWACG